MKDHPRVDAYGAVDELNAVLGIVAAHLEPGEMQTRIERVQSTLFTLGADLATPDGVKSSALVRMAEDVIAELEAEIDDWDAALPPLTNFVLPGGTVVAAHLHHARTVCRRAERRVITLSQSEPIGEVPVRYLNRLSDWLFVAARAVNAAEGIADRPWAPRGG
jgi:cob(I)alamin adenosyltransferase